MRKKDQPHYQQTIFDADRPATGDAGPVTCLGMTFPNDEERWKHFLGILREKLKDPEFRKIEGFPIGADEDILALSDPPYYTACPNPFIGDFIRHYGKPYDPNEPYSREPFAADVSEGKTDPIYKAHSYHTKVPHLAIAPSILHYTEPGDVVLDGFCGSGMTGVAAQGCGLAPEEYRRKVEADFEQQGLRKPAWGTRRVVLNDLSTQRRLKVFRLEAVRAGFKKAWQEHDYATVITVACKIPENVLQENPKLLMWYDQAMTKTGVE